ncbi:MAG: TIGR03118 family protein [Chloroflexota bacterium]
MHVRRLLVSGAAIGLLLAAAAPVAAHPLKDNEYAVTTLATGPSPDAALINGWGLTRGPTTPWWVADNGTDLSTLYNGAGVKQGLTVAIPEGAPTGTVFNGSASDFNGDRFLFDGESGKIFGWRGALGTTAEVLNADFADDAVFKGLAIATADVGGGAQQYLYATDFHNGRVVVFDHNAAARTWPGAFTDPKLPKHYAPFGIQTLNGMLFVTYAQTQQGSDDERAGQGRGIVDAFAADGTFLGRVASHGQLNAPWGLAWAPADFGRFGGDLLVGNFGDGRINAYRWDGNQWHHDGTLRDADGQKLSIDGLWAIAFGGGTTPTSANGLTNELFFAAGPDDEQAGAFGKVTALVP